MPANSLIVSPFGVKRLVDYCSMLKPQCKDFGQSLEDVFVAISERSQVVIDDKLRGLPTQTTIILADSFFNGVK